jgi:hypothetical protein
LANEPQAFVAFLAVWGRRESQLEKNHFSSRPIPTLFNSFFRREV